MKLDPIVSASECVCRRTEARKKDKDLSEIINTFLMLKELTERRTGLATTDGVSEL